MVELNEKIQEIAENYEKEKEKVEIVERYRKNPQKTITPKEEKRFINPNNEIIDNLQLRVSGLEYELQFIKDKLFSPAIEKGKEKLSTYGKQVRQRFIRSSL